MLHSSQRQGSGATSPSLPLSASGVNAGSREALPYLSMSEVYEDSSGRCLEASAHQLKASPVVGFIQCSLELITATASL